MQNNLFIKAICAVFSSWNNPRAIVYRKLNNITGLIGTTVQTMVFGNLNDKSATGEKKFYGEFLVNAQ
jgi:pyruvate, orthophosphate dikinase